MADPGYSLSDVLRRLHRRANRADWPRSAYAAWAETLIRLRPGPESDHLIRLLLRWAEEVGA